MDRADSTNARIEAVHDAMSLKIDNTNARIDAVNIRIDRINDQITDTNKKIDEAKGLINGINAMIDGINARIDGMQKQPNQFFQCKFYFLVYLLLAIIYYFVHCHFLIKNVEVNCIQFAEDQVSRTQFRVIFIMSAIFALIVSLLCKDNAVIRMPTFIVGYFIFVSVFIFVFQRFDQIREIDFCLNIAQLSNNYKEYLNESSRKNIKQIKTRNEQIIMKELYQTIFQKKNLEIYKQILMFEGHPSIGKTNSVLKFIDNCLKNNNYHSNLMFLYLNQERKKASQIQKDLFITKYLWKFSLKINFIQMIEANIKSPPNQQKDQLFSNVINKLNQKKCQITIIFDEINYFIGKKQFQLFIGKLASISKNVDNFKIIIISSNIINFKYQQNIIRKVQLQQTSIKEMENFIKKNIQKTKNTEIGKILLENAHGFRQILNLWHLCTGVKNFFLQCIEHQKLKSLMYISNAMKKSTSLQKQLFCSENYEHLGRKLIKKLKRQQVFTKYSSFKNKMMFQAAKRYCEK